MRKEIVLFVVLVAMIGLVIFLPPLDAKSRSTNSFELAEKAFNKYKNIGSKCKHGSELKIKTAAKAILFTELWFRHPHEKILEDILLTFLPSFVKYIDISIGPAQIKPSTANRIDKNTSFVGRLNDVCVSLDYVTNFLKQSSEAASFDSEVYNLAIKYNNGSKTRLQTHLYARMVTNIYHIQNLNLKE